MLLSIAVMKAKAQYVHYGTSENSNQNDQEPVQITVGYMVNPSTNQVQRIKIKIKTVDASVVITGVKELSSEYWTDLSTTPPIAEKIRYSSDEFEKQFEYKVYIPVLGKVVYF